MEAAARRRLDARVVGRRRVESDGLTTPYANRGRLDGREPWPNGRKGPLAPYIVRAEALKQASGRLVV